MKLSKSKYVLFFVLTSLLLSQSSICFAIKLEVTNLPGITEQSQLPDYIKAIFKLLMEIGAFLAVLLLVIGAIAYMTSADSPDARNNALSRIKGAILGLILMISSVVIINTISPDLKEIKVTPPEILSGTLMLEKGDELKRAPLLMGNTASIQGYQIYWPATVTVKDMQGNETTQNNCRKDAAGKDIKGAAYLIYRFKEPNFKHNMDPKRLLCGQRYPVDMASYEIREETPGVYLFPEYDCKVSDDKLPVYLTTSTPYWTYGGDYRSVRIINGDDPKKGPFYGIVAIDDEKYTGDGWTHVPPCPGFQCLNQTRMSGDTSRCENIKIGCESALDCDNDIDGGSSVIVYKWVGYDDAGNIAKAGDEVVLNTWPNYLGGKHKISDEAIRTGWWGAQGAGMIQIEPKEYPPDYSGTTVPEDQQEDCEDFKSRDCLLSILIRGDYLVIMSDSPGGGDVQAYPVSTMNIKDIFKKYRTYNPDNGPIDLSLDWYYVDGNNPDWLTIIPLAEKIESQ